MTRDTSSRGWVTLAIGNSAPSDGRIAHSAATIPLGRYVLGTKYATVRASRQDSPGNAVEQSFTPPRGNGTQSRTCGGTRASVQVRTKIRSTSLLAAAAAMALLTGLTACASSSTSTPAAESSSAAATSSAVASSTARSARVAESGSASADGDLVGTTFVATEVTGSRSIAPG